MELGSKRWITAYRGHDVPLHGGLSPCVPIGCMCERLDHRVQALQRQGLRLPKVKRKVLAVLRTVSFPVPAATLIAGAFFASREGAIVTGKREGGGGCQPGKPGGCLHCEHLLVFVLLVDQPVTSYNRGHLRHSCSPTTQHICCNSFPNRGVDVREFADRHRTPSPPRSGTSPCAPLACVLFPLSRVIDRPGNSTTAIQIMRHVKRSWQIKYAHTQEYPFSQFSRRLDSPLS